VGARYTRHSGDAIVPLTRALVRAWKTSPVPEGAVCLCRVVVLECMWGKRAGLTFLVGLPRRNGLGGLRSESPPKLANFSWATITVTAA
jgi:hypothetical protein